MSDIVLCEHCHEPVTNKNAHWIGDNPSAPYDEWKCQEPNWKERALKAEAELTEAYDEIFWTVPEKATLVEKIRILHGMEADALIRYGRISEQLKAAHAQNVKLKLALAQVQFKNEVP